MGQKIKKHIPSGIVQHQSLKTGINYNFVKVVSISS